jgi:hypothetical protein
VARPRRTERLRDLVARRAGGRCEYCRAPQTACGYRFHLEHIIPIARGGPDALTNRALACASCNLPKGDRVGAPDPRTGLEVRLFHQREDAWSDHFRWSKDGQRILGRTPIGRATVAALDMNAPNRREARGLWFRAGWLP